MHKRLIRLNKDNNTVYTAPKCSHGDAEAMSTGGLPKKRNPRNPLIVKSTKFTA